MPRYETPRTGQENEDTGRHRPDGVPPSWAVRPSAAPNGAHPAAPVADLSGQPRRPAPPGPPRFDDTGAYAGWLSAHAGSGADRPNRAGSESSLAGGPRPRRESDALGADFGREAGRGADVGREAGRGADVGREAGRGADVGREAGRGDFGTDSGYFGTGRGGLGRGDDLASGGHSPAGRGGDLPPAGPGYSPPGRADERTGRWDERTGRWDERTGGWDGRAGRADERTGRWDERAGSWDGGGRAEDRRPDDPQDYGRGFAAGTGLEPGRASDLDRDAAYGGYRAPAAFGVGAPTGVALLERTPDRYGLFTHDPDLPPEPGADDDDDTPGRHRRTAGPARNRRPPWVRTIGWVGVCLLVLLVAGGGFAAYQYKTLSGNIHRIDALAPTDSAIRDAAKQLDAENYLLIGSDTRAGANGAYEDTAGQVSGARSDTTILAHLSPNRDKAELVSFPRDSWVSLPACRKTGGGTEAAHDGQFNEAFSIGGPSCTVLAVQKLTGVKINHYVQVDFTGFKTMVDALNGVSICSTTPLRDDESGLRLPAGTSRLDGEQALAFVRARYGIGDGSDLGRIQRQQRFLGAMVRSATSTKLLVNPVALTKFLGAATKSLTLDKQTSFGDLKQLADQLHGLDPRKVSFLTAPIANPAYTPPGFPQPPSGQGGSRVLLDDTAGRTLYDSIINDKPTPPATPGKPTASPKPNVLTVAPQEVSVRVLNGVGVGGLARKVAGDLQSVGFTTIEPTNGPATAVTTVRYGADNKDEAQTLAAAVPGSVLQADASTDLDLVIGNNYTGVKTVKIGDPATAKAAVAPKPKPAASATPAVTAADARCG